MMFAMKKEKIIRILLVCMCLMFSGHIAVSMLMPTRISTYFYGSDSLQDNDYTDHSFVELNESVSVHARDKYTEPKGNGKDTVTVLFYLIGSDEPSSASATINTLNNILYASDSDRMNIVVQTGGSSSWNSKILEDDTIQRWTVDNEKLVPSMSHPDASSMCDPDTLYDFIKYGVSQYPSDRTFLFLSGSGSSLSFGYDPDGIHTDLSYNQIAGVLSRIHSSFDMICLDAPFAGTYENALLLEPYTDYLTAFETSVSSEGMLYQSFLTSLARNTSVSTLSLGKLLVDSYAINHAQKGMQDAYVLSLLDLSEIRYLHENILDAFGKELNTILANGTYQTLCDVLSSTTRLSRTRIDLAHFAHRFSLDTAQDLFDAITQMIKYRRTSSTANMYGLSFTCPYTTSSILLPQGYRDFLQTFALFTSLRDAYTSLVFPSLSDRLTHQETQIIEPITPELLTSSVSANTDLYDQETVLAAAKQVIDASVSSTSLQITRRNDQYILNMNQSDTTHIQNANMACFLPYGSAYLSLGATASTTVTSNHIPRFPSEAQWYYYEGQPVPFTSFYTDPSGNTIGYIHAMLNDQEVLLVACQDRFGFRMELSGAYVVYPDSTVSPKGMRTLHKGDQITFLYDMYGQDGTFSGTYTCFPSITLSDNRYLKYEETDQPLLLSIQLKDDQGTSIFSQMLTFPLTESR